MGQAQCQASLLSHASGCKAIYRVHTLPYPKMPNAQSCASPSGDHTLLEGGNPRAITPFNDFIRRRVC
jgi:hypothetical protein